MVKARIIRDGVPHLIIGLSHKNLELLKEDRPITFNLKEVGFEQDIQIFIFSEKDEQEMKKVMIQAGLIHPTQTIMVDSNADKN